MEVTMIQFVTALANVWILISTVPLMCTSNPVRFSAKDAKCIYNNNTYSAGEKFQPEACMFCKCPRHGGRVQCGIQDCQYTANCVRYQREENECCGRCAQVGCMHSDGKIYHPGAVISAEQCKRCFCPDDGGRIQCRKVPCPELTCVNSVHDEGHCCPRCPNGSNCWLNEKVINAGDIVLETECKICQCYEGRLSSWIPKNAQPRAVCFVLTNKEKEGCGDQEMLGDQALHRGVGEDKKPYLLHSTHARRKKLYQTFLKQHQRRKSKPLL